MGTTQLLVRLPDGLVKRFKRSVSLRQRSAFIQRLLEEALPPEDEGEDDPLYQAALAVEKEEELSAEMAERYGAEMTVPDWRERLVLFPLRWPRRRYGCQRHQAAVAPIHRLSAGVTLATLPTCAVAATKARSTPRSHGFGMVVSMRFSEIRSKRRVGPSRASARLSSG